MSKKPLFWLCATTAIALSACQHFIEQPLFEQGNMLPNPPCKGLSQGMTREQVEQRFGKPILKSVHPHHYDYVYTQYHGQYYAGKAACQVRFGRDNRVRTVTAKDERESLS